MYRITGKYCIILIILSISIGSCKKFIEIGPPNGGFTDEGVYSSDVSATSLVEGIYRQMATTDAFSAGGIRSISSLCALSADEMKFFGAGNYSEERFYQNSLTSTHELIDYGLWRLIYKEIYTANDILEGLSKYNGVSPAIKQQLSGEALFIRAFCHFYLTNLYGDVPLVISTDIKANSAVPRVSRAKILQQIIDDLKNAQDLMKDEYITFERIRPNKSVATALLARTYLYAEEWSSSEDKATAVINNTSQYALKENLGDVFLANSTEAIWQLRPGNPGYNTNEGRYFILLAPPSSSNPLSINDSLLDAFEMGDRRQEQWVGSISSATETHYFPYKYKVKTGIELKEYSMVLRLAEQFLIRAEARARQNNISGALVDLNTIRKRAGLNPIAVSTQKELLEKIAHERQVELFTEWGHRWLDLKRTGRADATLSRIKGPDWQSTDALFPIPFMEILANPKLTQNPGY